MWHQDKLKNYTIPERERLKKGGDADDKSCLMAVSIEGVLGQGTITNFLLKYEPERSKWRTGLLSFLARQMMTLVCLQIMVVNISPQRSEKGQGWRKQKAEYQPQPRIIAILQRVWQDILDSIQFFIFRINCCLPHSTINVRFVYENLLREVGSSCLYPAGHASCILYHCAKDSLEVHATLMDKYCNCRTQVIPHQTFRWKTDFPTEHIAVSEGRAYHLCINHLYEAWQNRILFARHIQ